MEARLAVWTTLPDRTRATLQVTKALLVSPAPRAFPTRTQAAAWTPKGNCKDPETEVTW